VYSSFKVPHGCLGLCLVCQNSCHIGGVCTSHIYSSIMPLHLSCVCLQPAPRHGLTRPRGGGGAGGAGGRGGFVPPFVGKAIDHHTGGGGAGGAAAAGAGGEEGPLSARTLEMLGGETLDSNTIMQVATMLCMQQAVPVCCTSVGAPVLSCSQQQLALIQPSAAQSVMTGNSPARMYATVCQDLFQRRKEKRYRVADLGVLLSCSSCSGRGWGAAP
jgi:hypothetical protein